MSDLPWSWATGLDRRQNQAIEDLQYEASRVAGRLRSAQRETKKQFAKQISSVNNRLDTVMDWLDLRFEQLDFDEYGVRREARNYFRALAAHDVVAIRELDDVPGYWLPPLAAPLAKLVLRRQNDRVEPYADTDLPDDIQASLRTGRDRDPIRGDLFIVATSFCFDLPRLREAPAQRLLAGPTDLEFGEDPTIVARGWRTLWEQAAQGDFGAAAVERLVDRLSAAFDPEALDAGAAESWRTAILRHGNGSGSVISAADRALPALTTTLSGLAEAVDPEAGTSHRETWQTCLQELVSEPSEPERPLVAAMRRLRPATETGDGEPTWRREAGTIATLLREDLLGDDVPAARRAVALRVAGPYLRQRIAALRDAELTTPEPTVALKVSGMTITVGHGDGDVDRTAYDRAVARRRPVETVWVPPVPLVVGIMAVLLVLATLAAVNLAWTWVVIALCLMVGPVWWLLGTRAAARAHAAHAAERVADLDTRIDRARSQALTQWDEHQHRRERTRVAAARLLDILPGA